MNDEVKQQTAVPAGADTAKLIAAIVLVLGGIVAYYVLKSRPEAWASWVAMFGGILLGIVVFALLAIRPQLLAVRARVARRVAQGVLADVARKRCTTTMVVLVFVVIASIFFWMLDLGLASVTKFFTGTGS